MSNFVWLGNTIKITVTFQSWNDTTNTGSNSDPNTVEGYIKNESKATIATFTPTRDSLGVYSYSWTPPTVGSFWVEFRGTYTGSATPVVNSIEELFTVSDTGVSTTLTNTLVEDQTLLFMAQLTPVYLDPDEILGIFPDASLIEINEFIYMYSKEIDELLGEDIVKTTLILDYIKASVLCSLSKIYEFGDTDLSSFTLGDLSVTTRSYAKSKVTRGNATSWCELAAALREEVLGKESRAKIVGVVKGDAYLNPMPPRAIGPKEIN